MLRIINIGLRSLKANKLISIVSILGLSVGLMLTIFLMAFTQNELSYDRFHSKHDRIYRVLGKLFEPGHDPEIIALCQGQLPDYLAQIPEIEMSLRVKAEKLTNLEYGNTRITNNTMLLADSTFFNFFSFKVLSGNALETMKAPDGLIICKSLAQKTFNTIDVIGRSVKVNGKDMTIGSVLNDVPPNSHLQFNMLHGANDPNFKGLVKNSGGEFYTYILLRKKVDKLQVLPKVCRAYTDLAADFWKNSDFKVEGLIQSLNDIELHSDNIVWDVPHGNIQNIYIAFALILFILVIAIINVVNLFTINAEAHVKEIGVRKVAGATRTDLIIKYIGEAELITLLSLLIAIFFVWMLWPTFNNFTGKSIAFANFFSVRSILLLLILSSLVGGLSGIYPAFYLSGISVIKVFKGSSSKKSRMSPLIKGMVLSQFFIVISLVACLLIFYRQMNYVRNKNLGFNKESIVGITGLTTNALKSYSAIKEKLLQNDGIVDVCLAQGIADNEMSGQYIKRSGDPSAKDILTNHTRTTEGFIKLFGIQISDGRDFDKTFSTDMENFIINEAACKALGLGNNAVGQKLEMRGDTGTVVGVARDFNFSSLHNKVGPLVITWDKLRWGTIYVKLKPSLIREGLQYISKTIRSIDPMYNLEYEFVDETFNKMYLQESKISKMLSVSAVISILLAGMGLVALTTFTILRRVKEIGIRKVNGASVTEILVQINSDFFRLVILAFIAAVPVSLIIMYKWIQNFAFNTGISWWIYLCAGGIVILSSVMAVSTICWRTATRNPVEALRYE